MSKYPKETLRMFLKKNMVNVTLLQMRTATLWLNRKHRRPITASGASWTSRAPPDCARRIKVGVSTSVTTPTAKYLVFATADTS